MTCGLALAEGRMPGLAEVRRGVTWCRSALSGLDRLPEHLASSARWYALGAGVYNSGECAGGSQSTAIGDLDDLKAPTHEVQQGL